MTFEIIKCIIVIQTTQEGGVYSVAMSEKIKIVLLKRKKSVTDLAKALNTSSQNLSNKLRNDNFRESELQEIAEALDCDLDVSFTLRDTGERV